MSLTEHRYRNRLCLACGRPIPHQVDRACRECRQRAQRIAGLEYQRAGPVSPEHEERIKSYARRVATIGRVWE